MSTMYLLLVALCLLSLTFAQQDKVVPKKFVAPTDPNILSALKKIKIITNSKISALNDRIEAPPTSVGLGDTSKNRRIVVAASSKKPSNSKITFRKGSTSTYNSKTRSTAKFQPKTPKTALKK